MLHDTNLPPQVGKPEISIPPILVPERSSFALIVDERHFPRADLRLLIAVRWHQITLGLLINRPGPRLSQQTRCDPPAGALGRLSRTQKEAFMESQDKFIDTGTTDYPHAILKFFDGAQSYDGVRDRILAIAEYSDAAQNL
jgi:ethanolamine utilization microcompartment shell protein EutS